VKIGVVRHGVGPISVAASSRRNRTPDKPNEDAYGVCLDAHGALLVVADGVTRSRSASGDYPEPSGAALAAKLVVRTLATSLGQANGTDPARALRRANRAIDRANRRAGVWDRLDYAEHDLWGAVATAVVVRDGLARWAHIGDSALLHLPVTGGLYLRTPDQVADAMHHLDALGAADLAAFGGRERYARQRLRNQPGAAHSYGVLTGEANAELYILAGAFPLASGDRLALCSDGVAGLRSVGGPEGWQSLEPWLRVPASNAAAAKLLDDVEAADERLGLRSDDKTVIIATVGD
jgi:serine/threonine protein phosphatase PrpC